MPIEFLMLAAATLLALFAFVPASMARARTYGRRWVVSNRETEGLPPLPAWGARAERAHTNLVVNYPAFAAAVLLLAVTGDFDLGTAIASAVFVAARIVHMVAYIGGAFWPRTISWALGLAATIYILVIAVFI
ncbi:MAG: MAPEG family protein [Gammaproteobacteria bacterium]|nr:MAPEG family protein [Gammaproteobacteria bacterium]